MEMKDIKAFLEQILNDDEIFEEEEEGENVGSDDEGEGVEEEDEGEEEEIEQQTEVVEESEEEE